MKPQNVPLFSQTAAPGLRQGQFRATSSLEWTSQILESRTILGVSGKRRCPSFEEQVMEATVVKILSNSF